MLGPGPVSHYYVVFLSCLQVWLLSAAVCNGLIQVDRFPDATQILAEHPQQQPRNSNESFKGVDYKTHFLNESFPDKAVVFFINLHAPIDANFTGSSILECWVIHPIIIAEQVHLQIIMKDNSTMIFTGGRAKAESQRPGFRGNKDDWWQWEEYQFDINFNLNMSRAACLAMDLNGTWRRNEDTIRFQYGYAPTLQSNIDAGKGKELFIVGGHPILECPFELERYPNPEILWKLPSGVERKSECLWFPDVSNHHAGEYTCTAKNEYGNRTYAFQVSVREATFLERWDRRLTSALVAFLEPFWRPLAILLMLTGHTQSSEGNVMRRFSCAWLDYTDYVNE